MANISYQLCPMSDLDKTVYYVQQAIQQSLVGYIGQENVALTGDNLRMRLDGQGELHVYYMPQIPVEHIKVTCRVTRS